MLKMLFFSALLAASAGAYAQKTDDGFIWIDANTRIKVLKPTSAAGGGSAPEKKAPESSRKGEKKEAPKK